MFEGSNYDLTHQAHPGLVRQIVAELGIIPGGPLLDVGCGTGLEGSWLASLSRRSVYGVEPSRSMAGRSRSRGVLVAIGEAELLPFSERSFAGVSFFFSAHHVSDIDVSFREAVRVLKPSGSIIVVSISRKQMSKSFEYQLFPGLLRVDIARIPCIKRITATLQGLGLSCRLSSAHYETRSYGETYLERVKNKYRTGLKLITQSSYEQGLVRLRRYLRAGRIVSEEIFVTIVTASEGDFGKTEVYR